MIEYPDTIDLVNEYVNLEKGGNTGDWYLMGYGEKIGRSTQVSVSWTTTFNINLSNEYPDIVTEIKKNNFKPLRMFCKLQGWELKGVNVASKAITNALRCKANKRHGKSYLRKLRRYGSPWGAM